MKYGIILATLGSVPALLFADTTPAPAGVSVEEYVSCAEKDGATEEQLDLLEQALPEILESGPVTAITFPETRDDSLLLLRFRHTGSGREAYVLGDQNGDPICHINVDEGMRIKALKLLDNELQVTYLRLRKSAASGNPAEIVVRRFPMFGIAPAVVRDSDHYSCISWAEEGLPTLTLSADSVSYHYDVWEPSLSCTWHYAESGETPVRTELKAAVKDNGCELKSEGVMSIRWALSDGWWVLACHTQKSPEYAVLDFFLFNDEGGRRYIPAGDTGAARQAVSYSEEGLYEGRLDLHISSGAATGQLEEKEVLEPLFPETPILGSSYCTELSDDDLVAKAEALHVSPAQRRVLKEVVLDGRTIPGQEGAPTRWIGEIRFPYIPSPDFIVVSVDPKLSGTGFGFWTVVADKDGRALCRIDHQGSLDVSKVWREGDNLCLSCINMREAKELRFPVFGQGAAPGGLPRFQTDGGIPNIITTDQTVEDSYDEEE